MTDEFDYGPVRSTFLEEVRTILSRAETALANIRPRTKDGEPMRGTPERLYLTAPEPIYSDTEFHVTTWTDRHGKERHHKTRKFLGYTEGEWIPHPGYEDGVAALEEVVAKLAKFRKTGKRKSR